MLALAKASANKELELNVEENQDQVKALTPDIPPVVKLEAKHSSGSTVLVKNKQLSLIEEELSPEKTLIPPSPVIIIEEPTTKST